MERSTSLTAEQVTGVLAAMACAVVLGVGIASLGPRAVVAGAPADAMPVSAAVTAPQPTPRDRAVATYSVEPGDTLSSIAEAHGATLADLLELNDLAQPDRLALGQEITVPGRTRGVRP